MCDSVAAVVRLSHAFFVLCYHTLPFLLLLFFFCISRIICPAPRSARPPVFALQFVRDRMSQQSEKGLHPQPEALLVMLQAYTGECVELCVYWWDAAGVHG